MNEKTLIIIKSDALQRNIVGDIIRRFERVGLKIVGAKMFIPTEELANQHYPKDREDFIKGMGQKTLDSYRDQGLDPIKLMGSDDPKKIGQQIQKWLVDSLVSSPVFAMVLEGPHAVEIGRKIVGFTLPAKAEPGTIRGDYSFDSSAFANTAGRPIRNLVHASGDTKEAEFEINLWFKPEELYEYDTIHHKHMTA